MLSSTSPHLPLQEPSGAQQLDSPFGLVPHLHLVVGFAIVVVAAMVVATSAVEDVHRRDNGIMSNNVS